MKTLTRTLPVLVLLFIFLPSPAGAASLDKMAGEMIMVGFRGLTVEPGDPIYEDLAAGRVGGVVLFDYDVSLKSPVRNILSAAQLTALTRALRDINPDVFIAVDQEGGKVRRLKLEHGFPPTRSARQLGRTRALGETNTAARIIGETMVSAGLNVDFAPVVDLDVNPDSPAIGRYERSFSDDPIVVARHGASFVRGLAEAGVAGCLKHFPGHGSATEDSHQGVTDITHTWTPRELEPFQRIIAQGLAPSIMTGHLYNARLDPVYPATLSRRTIAILRERMEYDGVIFTDDMQMGAITTRYGQEEAIVLAVNAGCDVLLFANNLVFEPDISKRAHAVVLRAVRDGRIPQERIEQAYERIMRLKRAIRAGDPLSSVRRP
jgi:beta-N-acetylhexosaminidase